MANETILVTGSSGAIGRSLVKFLNAKGYTVKTADIVEGPEEDLSVLDNALRLTKGVDQIYHLAADVGGIGYISDPANSRNIVLNSVINYNVFEAARQNGVKKVLFASSSCIYSEPGVRKESDALPAEPENVYGWEKLYGEIIAESFPEIDTKIVRFQNIYGPLSHYNDGREMAVVALCRKIRDSTDGTIEVWGDGNQYRNWVYVDDCCEAIHELMNSDTKEPINLGVEEPISIKELAEKLIAISGKDITIKYLTDKPTGPMTKSSDNTLRKKYLKWEPKVDIDEGLKRTYEWVTTLK